MAEGKKRKVHSADFKANSHQTIKKPESLTPPYPNPPHLILFGAPSPPMYWVLDER